MKCKFCDKIFKNNRSMGIHISHKHRNELKKYKEKNIKRCKLCNEILQPNLKYIDGDIELKYNLDNVCLSGECLSKKLNPASKQYQILVKGKTEEEASEWLKEKGKKSGQTARKRGIRKGNLNPASKQYQILVKGKTEEEASEWLKEKGKKSGQTARKRGLNRGELNPFSKQYWINKGKTEEEASLIIKERNQFRKEYWIKHWGFEEQEAVLKAKSCCSHNELFYISKYGLEEGLKLYNERIKKLTFSYRYEKAKDKNSFWKKYHNSTSNLGKASKASLKYFIPLYKSLRKQGLMRYDIMFGVSGTREFFLRNDDRIYFYDFYIKPLNLIIEYNGHHVHVSDRTLDDWKHAFNKKSKEEILKIDEDKKELALQNNKKIIYIWSDLDQNENLDIIKEELNQHGYTI